LRDQASLTPGETVRRHRFAEPAAINYDLSDYWEKRAMIYVVSVGIPAAMLLAFIFELRRHPGEIYTIWYIFSFFFLLFLFLYSFAEKEGKEVTDILGPSLAGNLKVVYDYLTNFDDEFRLVAVLVYLAIGPQLLTYLLSGLSGSAIPPMFVRQIRTIAVWSLIKFTAALGGILLAHLLANFWFGKQVSLREFLEAVAPIIFAFGAARVNQIFNGEFEVRLLPVSMLKVHEFFTRYRGYPKRSKRGEALADLKRGEALADLRRAALTARNNRR
jgi:hypothetical protein